MTKIFNFFFISEKDIKDTSITSGITLHQNLTCLAQQIILNFTGFFPFIVSLELITNNTQQERERAFPLGSSQM